jgi:ubiquinone/menaquinone biosynthesis C-methylase UbiE
VSRPDSETTRFYESHVRRYGYGYRALGFNRRSSQEKRFSALASIGSLDGARLLDVGCGFGDLLAWLRARGVQPRYTGLDLTASMIERCRKRFSEGMNESSARFLVGDALTWEADGEYDYVIASGIFGYNAKDTRARIQPTMQRLFAICGRGLAVNFLSGCAPTRSPGRLYVHPSDVLQYALRLTPAVRLDHTYMPNDFTLSMYKKPAWEQQPIRQDLS